MLSWALGISVKQRGRAHNFPARLVLTLFIALTVLLQGYATQTHVHFLGDHDAGVITSSGGGAEVTKTSGSQKGEHGKLPSKDDPANCPLCQQILVAGAFVSPSTVVLLLPTQLTFPAPVVPVVSNPFRSISHNWYGRAPPHA